VAAKYILAALSIVFFALAIVRTIGTGGAAFPQIRTWVIIGIIFGLVSAWLFSQG